MFFGRHGQTRALSKLICALGSDFAHDAEDVVCGVFEEGHPEIVVGHFGDEVRIFEERDAAGLDCTAGGVDVVDFVVEDGAAAWFLLLRCGEHEADLTALEKGELAGVEEESHPQDVLVEVLCASDVIDGEGDLADGSEMDRGGRRGVMTHLVPPFS